MSKDPNISRRSVGLLTAIVLSLGLLGVYLLAGGHSSRQDDATAAAAHEERPSAETTVGSTAPDAPVADVPTTTPPVAAAVGTPSAVPPAAAPTPPRVTSRRPAAARPAAAPAAPTSLAGAWIAAGARGVDPDATAGPSPASASPGSAPAPVAIDIPRIGVAAPVDPAGLNRDGTLEVPEDFARTSYYTGGPAPGDAGPAVIVGHVDNRRGPAVFYRLRELQTGDEVAVRRADGSTVVFVVERSKQVPKNNFPTDEVYGPTPGPTLRLVTCGGSFDRSSGHYRDNIIVFLTIKA